MKRCAHCGILPVLDWGSVCGPCWLTAVNAHNSRLHTDVSGCSCWLSHYDSQQRAQWRQVMTR